MGWLWLAVIGLVAFGLLWWGGVKRSLATLGGAALLVGAVQGQATAPVSPVPKTIELGISRVVKSRALSEDRVVNVLLPLTYAKFPTRRYPVLYLIDGGVDQDFVHIAGVARLGAMWSTVWRSRSSITRPTKASSACWKSCSSNSTFCGACWTP